MSRTNKRSDVALYESIASLPGMSNAGMSMGGMGTGGGPEEPQTQSLWQVIDDRMRGRWLYAIVLGTLGSLVLATIGYLSAEPMFVSTGLIQITPEVKPIYQKIDNEHNLEHYDRFVATQVEYIKGQTVIGAAAQSEEARKMNLSKGFLRAGISAERDPRSQLIYVSFEAEDPDIAVVALNSVLDAYYEEYGQYNMNHISNTMKELEERVQTHERTRMQLEREISAISEKHGATDLAMVQRNNLDQINRLSAVITEGRRALARMEGTPGQAADGAAVSVPTDSALLQIDPRLGPLAQALYQAEQNFELVRNRYKPGTAMYDSKEREFRAAQDAYDRGMREATETWRNLPPEEREAKGMSQVVTAGDLTAFEQERKDIEARQRELIKDIDRLSQLTYEETQVQKDIEGMRNRMDAFETELKPLSSMITISEYGVRPDAAEKDQRRTRALMGLALGMGASFGFFFLLGTVDRRAYGASQLGPAYGTSGIPCLGVLPDLGASLSDPETSDVASHCVHQIRNQIEAVRDPTAGYMLAISSPFQGDGKTSIIMALGWSYAAAGYNTLLIDCDMVGRSLTRQLGLTGREGLKEALVEKELNGSVNKMPVANLSAVPCGVDARFGPENVRRVDLERLIDQVRDQFDIILVDTGPLLGSLESTPVTAIADGVVLSVRRGRSRSKLEDCVNRLKMVGTPCIGMILNCAARSDCNRYVSEASLAAAEEERMGRGGAEAAGRQPGERNILVKAVQSTTRARQLPESPALPPAAADVVDINERTDHPEPAN